MKILIRPRKYWIFLTLTYLLQIFQSSLTEDLDVEPENDSTLESTTLGILSTNSFNQPKVTEFQPLEDQPIPVDLNNKPSINLPKPPPLMKPKIKTVPYYEVSPEWINSHIEPPAPQMNTDKLRSKAKAGPTSIQTKIQLPNPIQQKKTSVSGVPIKQEKINNQFSNQFKIQFPKDLSEEKSTEIDKRYLNQPRKKQPQSQIDIQRWTVQQGKVYKWPKPTYQKKQQFYTASQQNHQLNNQFVAYPYSYPINRWLSSYWTRSSSGSCPSSVCTLPNEFLPHPNDCCSFIICEDCVPHYMRCGPNTQYNPWFLTCTYPYQNQCIAPNPDCHATANEYGSGNLKM